MTIEVKLSKGDVGRGELERLAGQALEQIEERRYDARPLPEVASGRLRWGIAFGGKRVVARCCRVG
ncbi:hypothetical protein H6A23_06615 [Olsenella uli]|uniref:hypothetical protein n=1 Tax=Olsenella uli TaxID=133926 RepID=UPI0019585F0B|nr:hypothetical protein [Olsenella uli]MBM6816840.1 hypothetical protein [Olsenella uli]